MVGESPDSEPIVRACNFLLSKQNPNGGWGEDFTSCYNRSYAPKGMEDYLSFNINVNGYRIRFIVTAQFLASSLEVLAQTLDTFPITTQVAGDNPLLRRKGVFCYDYIPGRLGQVRRGPA